MVPTPAPLSLTAWVLHCVATAVGADRIMHAYRRRNRLVLFADVDVDTQTEAELQGPAGGQVDHRVGGQPQDGAADQRRDPLVNSRGTNGVTAERTPRSPADASAPLAGAVMANPHWSEASAAPSA